MTKESKLFPWSFSLGKQFWCTWNGQIRFVWLSWFETQWSSRRLPKSNPQIALRLDIPYTFFFILSISLFIYYAHFLPNKHQLALLFFPEVCNVNTLYTETQVTLGNTCNWWQYMQLLSASYFVVSCSGVSDFMSSNFCCINIILGQSLGYGLFICLQLSQLSHSGLAINLLFCLRTVILLISLDTGRRRTSVSVNSIYFSTYICIIDVGITPSANYHYGIHMQKWTIISHSFLPILYYIFLSLLI